jgi:hypothetical protein
MAPTHSKPIPEPRAPGVRKRVLAASLASTDNVDVAAVKRRKLEEAVAVQRQQRQPSVENVKDDDNGHSSNTNLRPRDASRILEAADGSDDDVQLDIEGRSDSDDEELPGLEEVDEISDSKLAEYLSTEPKNVKDPLLWWVEMRAVYPRLSQMARNYLTIPGM